MPKIVGRRLNTPSRQVRPSSKRITGRKLQQIRLDMWTSAPHCVNCNALTAYPYGFQIDHIIELAQGGMDVPENRQLLCLKCHDEKTLEVRRNGQTLESIPPR